MRLTRKHVFVAVCLCFLGLGAVAGALTLADPGAATPGEWLAEQQGEVVLHHYATLEQDPIRPKPTWLPGRTSQVTVKQPGPRDQGSTWADLKLDGTVPANWRFPAHCRPVPWSMPFDGGGYWPLTTGTPLRECASGSVNWLLFRTGNHVYLWPAA